MAVSSDTEKNSETLLHRLPKPLAKTALALLF